MSLSRIVDVLVPVAVDTAYSYALPNGLELAAGDVVAVPLGTRETVGVVWGVREGAVGAFMLALAPDSAVVGTVVLNRLAITIVEALLLAGAAGWSRGRRRSYPAAE